MADKIVQTDKEPQLQDEKIVVPNSGYSTLIHDDTKSARFLEQLPLGNGNQEFYRSPPDNEGKQLSTDLSPSTRNHASAWDHGRTGDIQKHYHEPDHEHSSQDRKMCGMKRRTFIITFIVALLIAIAAVVGGAVGGTIHKSSKTGKQPDRVSSWLTYSNPVVSQYHDFGADRQHYKCAIVQSNSQPKSWPN